MISLVSAFVSLKLREVRGSGQDDSWDTCFVPCLLARYKRYWKYYPDKLIIMSAVNTACYIISGHGVKFYALPTKRQIKLTDYSSRVHDYVWVQNMATCIYVRLKLDESVIHAKVVIETSDDQLLWRIAFFNNKWDKQISKIWKKPWTVGSTPNQNLLCIGFEAAARSWSSLWFCYYITQLLHLSKHSQPNNLVCLVLLIVILLIGTCQSWFISYYLIGPCILYYEHL